jgi:hypothetical protein
MPVSPFFQPNAFEARLNQIKLQAFDGMVFPVYRRELEASANAWFAYHAELAGVEASRGR